jgi:hypothetical protein
MPSAGVLAENVKFEEIQLPSTRRPGDGFVIPSHVLDRMKATSAPPAIRPRPSRFKLRDDRFLVSADGGVVLATEVSAVAAHLAARDRRGSTQHAADRLVAVTL